MEPFFGACVYATLLNVSFILCSLFLAPYLERPVLALAWAVFFGGILQLVFQLPALKKYWYVAPHRVLR